MAQEKFNAYDYFGITRDTVERRRDSAIEEKRDEIAHLDPFDPRSREALNKFIFVGYCLELDKDGAYTEWLEGRAFAKDAADFETAQSSPHLYLGINQTFEGPSLFDQIDQRLILKHKGLHLFNEMFENTRPRQVSSYMMQVTSGLYYTSLLPADELPKNYGEQLFAAAIENNKHYDSTEDDDHQYQIFVDKTVSLLEDMNESGETISSDTMRRLVKIVGRVSEGKYPEYVDRL